MRILGIAAIIALLTLPASLTRPACAQTPHINLLSETPSKTPEEKEAEEARDKAYKESLKKIPEAKTSNDPWGNVRSEPPKTSAKAPAAAKSRTKTGSASN
jgi:hypothetical protein